MMIRTPAELFNLGQRNLCNFERTGDIGITGICIKGSDMNAMKCINKFMYTVYSAGANSKTQSVEGVLLKSTFDGILPLLKEHNYWYLANNPVTLEEYARNLGTDHNKMEHITMVIPRSECTNYRLQRDNDPFYRMAVVSGSDAEQVQLKGSFYVYFLNDPVVNAYCADGVGSEVLLYVDARLFSVENPLVGLVIEDPTISQKNLYSELGKMLRKVSKK